MSLNQFDDQEIYQLRERLVQFQRLSILHEITSGIAHEINQSLTGIASYARGCRRQLESGRVDTASLLPILDKICDQAQQSGAFVHNLRRLADHYSSEHERCDLNQLVQNSIKLAAIDANLPEIPIKTSLSKSRLIVAVDPIQIQQTLLHLLHNALEANSEITSMKAIDITTIVDHSGCARVTISDYGSGLTASARERLFDPFFTTKPHSLGLGLAVCRTQILAHGGRIGFRDNPEGGAIFYFTLPMARSNGGTD